MEYHQYFQTIITNMKLIQEAPQINLDAEDVVGTLDIMKEYLLFADTFNLYIRSSLNSYYANSLKKLKVKEQVMKDIIEQINNPVTNLVANQNSNPIFISKYPIVKVKEYVTEIIKKAGFKCNPISGLPDELEPWYGHQNEHGKKLHKRINKWLDMKKESKKVEKKESKKTAKKAPQKEKIKEEEIKKEEYQNLIDASSALTSF